MKPFNISSPAQVQVQVVKTGWIKRSYRFLSGDDVVAELNYTKSYSNNASAIMHGVEFAIRRRGFWKQYLEISSNSNEHYNMKVGLSWRGTMNVTDPDRKQYVFRQTSVWKSKWGWINNRSERLLVEMRSKNFSRKNRGIIEIKDGEMKDLLFWIIVSWFVIMTTEAEAAAVSVV